MVVRLVLQRSLDVVELIAHLVQRLRRRHCGSGLAGRRILRVERRQAGQQKAQQEALQDRHPGIIPACPQAVNPDR
jgi:hypothetical protein